VRPLRPPSPIRVTVWNEFIHEREDAAVADIYPGGMHLEIARALAEHAGGRLAIRTATLDEPGHGLPPEVLAATDVLVWWGHRAHDAIEDELVDRLQARVLGGMGLVALHAAIESKLARRLLGTSCTFRWREEDDRELVWVVDPAHPIAQGLPPVIEISHQEMYGEPFDIPAPDELVFISAFSGGEVFRSGCCFRRGRGRIFLFSPGHETWPVYHHPEIRRVLANAVDWAYAGGLEASTPPPPRNAPAGWFEAGSSG
jgi:trehalose utilization protein